MPRKWVQRLIRHFGAGGSLTLRRPHSLRLGGEAATVLVVFGDHPAGASSIQLGGARLSGELVAGVRLEIAGQILSAAEDSTAQAQRLEVLLSNPLAGPVADGAVVTLLDAAVEATYSTAPGALRDTEPERLARGLAKAFLAAPGREPRTRDVETASGQPVQEVVAVRDGRGVVAWAIYYGSAAA